MRNLFYRESGKNHCLATKEIIKPGLCIQVDNKTLSVITDPTGVGKVAIKNNGITGRVVYRVPGMFFYRHSVTWTSSTWYYERRVVYVENGLIGIVELGDKFITQIAKYYFEKLSGYFYTYWSSYSRVKCFIEYSLNGMDFTDREFNTTSDPLLNNIPYLCAPTMANQYDWHTLALRELVSDGAGGFNLVFSVYGDRNNQYSDRWASFAHSFQLDDFNSELVATDDFVYAQAQNDVRPSIPKYYNDPEVYTVNGFTETKTGDNYIFSKTVSGETEQYILSTNKVIWDPISQKYFMLKAGNSYVRDNHEYFDLNIYESTSLEESSFIFKQKLQTYYYQDITEVMANISVARQNEYI